MSFSFVTLAAVVVVCVAAASSCLSALLCEKIFRRSFGRYRLVFSVLFLSAGIVCVSLLLVFVPLPRDFTRYDALYYGIVFVVSFVAVFFPRVVGIPVVFLYSVYAVVCIFALNATFDKPQDLYEVFLSPSRCEINGKPFDVDDALFSSENTHLYVRFSAAIPSETLLLPTYQIWLRPEGLSADSDESSVVQYAPNGLVGGLIYRVLLAGEHLSALLTGSASEQSPVRQYFVPLEQAQFYPVVYGIMPIMEEKKLDFKTKRLF